MAQETRKTGRGDPGAKATIATGGPSVRLPGGTRSRSIRRRMGTQRGAPNAQGSPEPVQVAYRSRLEVATVQLGLERHGRTLRRAGPRDGRRVTRGLTFLAVDHRYDRCRWMPRFHRLLRKSDFGVPRGPLDSR